MIKLIQPWVKWYCHNYIKWEKSLLVWDFFEDSCYRLLNFIQSIIFYSLHVFAVIISLVFFPIRKRWMRVFDDIGHETEKNIYTCSHFCSLLELTESCLKYPLVEHYLKSKSSSRALVVKYLACRGLTFMTLLLGGLFLSYYIHLASVTDEFSCDLRTGALQNDTAVPSAVQCKLVAVGVFGLLSKINLGMYALLSPVVVYATLRPAHQSSGFLRPYEILPGFGTLGVITPFYNDLSIYLLFLKENLSHVESFKCLQVGLDTDLDQIWW